MRVIFFAIFALHCIAGGGDPPVSGGAGRGSVGLQPHHLQCSVPAETAQQQSPRSDISPRAALPLPARRLVTGNPDCYKSFYPDRGCTEGSDGVTNKQAADLRPAYNCPGGLWPGALQSGARGERCSAALPPTTAQAVRSTSARSPPTRNWGAPEGSPPTQTGDASEVLTTSAEKKRSFKPLSQEKSHVETGPGLLLWTAQSSVQCQA